MRAVTAYPITGGNSSNRQRMLPSVNPSFRSLVSNVSIAFDTIELSRRRSAVMSAASIGLLTDRSLSKADAHTSTTRTGGEHYPRSPAIAGFTRRAEKAERGVSGALER